MSERIERRAVTMKQTNFDQTGSSITTVEAGWYVPEPGVKFKVLVSTEQAAGSYCCLETIAESGTGSPIHIHHNEDEHFLILEGTAHLLLGEEKIDVADSATGESPEFLTLLVFNTVPPRRTVKTKPHWK